MALPTGSGKSLCYCLLPKAFDFLRLTSQSAKSIVVIVSPLIALMQDQVCAMEECNVVPVYAGAVDDESERDICEGKYQLVFLSPESLLTDGRWCDMLQSAVYHERLAGLVIDEAHCVKEW